MSDSVFQLTKPKENLEHSYIVPSLSNGETKDPTEQWKMNFLSHGQSLKFHNQ